MFILLRWEQAGDSRPAVPELNTDHAERVGTSRQRRMEDRAMKTEDPFNK